MIDSIIRLMGAGALCLAASASLAQADPLDPRTPVPQASYRSSLSSAPALDEAKLGSWRDANDTVTRIGGWREYAREAQRVTPSNTASPSSAPAPTAPPAGAGAASSAPARAPHQH